MNLEPIIQSEVSQKKKYKYLILMYAYGIQKDATDELVFRAAMKKHTSRADLWLWGEGEMYGVSNKEIYNTICKIDSQWECSLWLREWKQGLCDNLEGWDGEGDGRETWEGRDMDALMADSCWCIAENHKVL